MERIGTIYKIENMANGKVYIGQTIKKAEYRTNRHKVELANGNHSNTHLQRAFNKHGVDNFKYSIVEEVPFLKLDEKEVYWISYHKERSGVYNIEGGGNKYKIINEETRERISISVRKSMLTPEYKQRLKIFCDNLKGSNNINARNIICINDNLVYDTLTDAGIYYGINITQISKIVTGEITSSYSRKLKEYIQFSYYEKGKQYTLKEIKNIKDPVQVICVNTKEIFESTHEASKRYNISQGSLIRALKGEGKYLGKDDKGNPLLWEYLKNYDKDKEYKVLKYDGVRNHKSNPVICITTGEYFESQRQAEIKYNLSTGKISMVCTGKRKHTGKLPNGTKLSWKYAEL